jgi:hypothetical protein
MATTTKTMIKRVNVALNFPTQISAVIVYAKAIYKAMLNNAYFTGSAAKLALLSTDTGALDAKETGCNTVPPTNSVEERNAALEKVKSDIRSLSTDVQQAADADPSNAEIIITSSAMSVKKNGYHGKQQNTAKDGPEEGTVILTAEGSGPHEWRESTDGVIWILLTASRTSKTSITGLTPGTVYFFQNRRILANSEISEWSQSVKIRAK